MRCTKTYVPNNVTSYLVKHLNGIFCLGVAGKFPPNYMGGMMSGQALGGIFPSLVNILVIAIQVSMKYSRQL